MGLETCRPRKCSAPRRPCEQGLPRLRGGKRWEGQQGEGQGPQHSHHADPTPVARGPPSPALSAPAKDQKATPPCPPRPPPAAAASLGAGLGGGLTSLSAPSGRNLLTLGPTLGSRLLVKHQGQDPAGSRARLAGRTPVVPLLQRTGPLEPVSGLTRDRTPEALSMPGSCYRSVFKRSTM